jgi:hypothetical protein
MDNRKYRFAMKFAVERDVIIEAEDLVEAMALLTNISPEMLLAEIDGSDCTFPPNINDKTQVYPEHDYLYRCDDDGDELDSDLLDDKDEV